MVDVMDEVPNVTSFKGFPFMELLSRRVFLLLSFRGELENETNCDEQKRVNANGKSNALSHELGATFM